MNMFMELKDDIDKPLIKSMKHTKEQCNKTKKNI